MAIAETVKLVVAVALGCLLLFAGQRILSWREAAQQNENRGRTLEATSGIIKQGQKADEDRLIIDFGILQGREQFNRQLQEGRRNEPEIAARADRAVPVSRLRAFHERRLARERLGCVGKQCQPRPENPAPAQR